MFYDPDTYNTHNVNGQHVHCTNCRKGFYCDLIGMSDNIKPCPVGKFCTEGKFYKGTDINDPSKPAWYTNPVSCLPGTYNPNPYATKPEDCLPCPPGRYCAAKDLENPTGHATNEMCSAGYFCREGSSQKQPGTMDSAVTPPRWGYCPEGSYCEEGTAYPTPCPPGTYGAATKLTSVAECTACPAGYYCPIAGMKYINFADNTYKCEAGYYCPTATAPSNIGSISPR